MPDGEYVASIGSPTTTLNLAYPARYPLPPQTNQKTIAWRLPAALGYHVTTSGPTGTVTASAAWTFGVTQLPVAGCTGFAANTSVADQSYTPPLNIGFGQSCGGGFLNLYTPVAFSSFGAADVLGTGGNANATVTSGPNVNLWPGDMIWSDAFPFGAMIGSSSGTIPATFPYNITVVAASLYPGPTATVTHTSGSGVMWKIPAAFKTKVEASSEKNGFGNFPVGLQSTSSSGLSPAIGRQHSAPLLQWFWRQSDWPLYFRQHGRGKRKLQ